MANITIKNLEVESTQLQQLSPEEMEKIMGGFMLLGQFSQMINRLMAITFMVIFINTIFSLLSTGWGEEA
ncbi:hypothetical protein [Anabaenopsis arnoldii]|uniref:Uncharacterized protein n=1 Tax=Anabaenopsis arnoldii TaxID=2152938 RepID=A0ABT5ALT5_9CYAN|nr:hypothetical protein [Anabaenopsis arnoldii]MDB9538255.1 hypothetical protein [Anabaenopsis arnoldii]MDH6090308.1 hypothetical protein [Anabaenopsis arnoldii]